MMDRKLLDRSCFKCCTELTSHCPFVAVWKRLQSAVIPFSCSDRKVITGAALECNIIQNIRPLHARLERRENQTRSSRAKHSEHAHGKNIDTHRAVITPRPTLAVAGLGARRPSMLTLTQTGTVTFFKHLSYSYVNILSRFQSTSSVEIKSFGDWTYLNGLNRILQLRR